MPLELFEACYGSKLNEFLLTKRDPFGKMWYTFQQGVQVQGLGEFKDKGNL